MQLTDLAEHRVTLINCLQMGFNLHFSSMNQMVICLSGPLRKQVDMFTPLIYVICSFCLFKANTIRTSEDF